MTELENKRKQRKKQTAEDFTPLELVNEMLDKLPDEVWADPNKTFLDNSGGNGNFVVEVLRRKLERGHDPLKALSSVYSVELMPDNVQEMHQRMFYIVKPYLKSDAEEIRAWEILHHNCVVHDALTWDYENWCSPNNHHTVPLF